MATLSLANLPSFVYPPLQPGRIRLIRVQQQPDPRLSVSCKMKIVNLEDYPQFTALSYTWGGQIPTRILFVEDAWLKITPNLHAFLLQVQSFRNEGEEKDVEWIWADSLCINQQDNADKSVQLELREEILLNGGSQTIAIHSPATQTTSNLDLPDVLISHPYWRRVWILQEITSNPTDGVSLWYGHTSCSFSRFLNLTQAVLSKKSLYEQDDDRRKPFKVLQVLQTSRRDSCIKLSDIFSIKGQWEASDPKDKLLALLQLIPDGLGYTPDYALSVHQLYADFAKHLMRRYGHLDFLEYITNADTLAKTTDSSSWAPNLAVVDHRLSVYRPSVYYKLAPFRDSLLKGRLEMPSERRTAGLSCQSQTLHVDAIILGVYSKNGSDLNLIPLTRYSRAFPDEVSLWTAALDSSAAILGRYVEPGLWYHISWDSWRKQHGDILCVLPGLRWPAFIRPVQCGQGHMTFIFLACVDISSDASSDNCFAEHMFDIMLDDILLNVAITHDSYVPLLDRQVSRQKAARKREAAQEKERVRWERVWSIYGGQEKIYPHTDLTKYAVRIQLV